MTVAASAALVGWLLGFRLLLRLSILLLLLFLLTTLAMLLRTMVGLQARQNPSILKTKEIVESGKLGKILGTTMFGHVRISSITSFRFE